MREFLFQTEADKCVFPAVKRESSVSLELAPMIYTLGHHPDRGVYFKPVDNFNMPKKIYGEVNRNIDRYFRSYELNDKNVGVALIGVKGSGKTITLKQIANKAVELGMPVILVNSKETGIGFVEFLAGIKQQCVVCFDEVDKTYTHELENGRTSGTDQNTLVQLLDGAVPSSKKMFIFTLNEKSAMSDLFFGRPSRVRYVSYFSNLEIPVVIDYLRENLKDCTEDKIREYVHFCMSQEEGGVGITFDVMAEYVREMNQFNESLAETVKAMNGELKSRTAWLTATVFEEGKEPYASKSVSRGTGLYPGNLKSTLIVSLRSTPEATEEGDVENAAIRFKENVVAFTDKDFLEVGPGYDEFCYKKDNIQVNFRYVTSGEHTQAEHQFIQDEHKHRKENGEEEIPAPTEGRGAAYGFAERMMRQNPMMLSSAATMSSKHHEKIQNSSVSGAHVQQLPRSRPLSFGSDFDGDTHQPV